MAKRVYAKLNFWGPKRAAAIGFERPGFATPAVILGLRCSVEPDVLDLS